MKTSPTQRSLKLLRDDGWICQVVEHFNQYARVRQDLFNGIDIVCLKPGEILGVQTTSGTNVSHRLAKLRAEPKIATWLAAGGKLVVHGWRKLASTGKWECRVEEVTLETIT